MATRKALACLEIDLHSGYYQRSSRANTDSLVILLRSGKISTKPFRQLVLIVIVSLATVASLAITAAAFTPAATRHGMAAEEGIFGNPVFVPDDDDDEEEDDLGVDPPGNFP